MYGVLLLGAWTISICNKKVAALYSDYYVQCRSGQIQLYCQGWFFFHFVVLLIGALLWNFSPVSSYARCCWKLNHKAIILVSLLLVGTKFINFHNPLILVIVQSEFWHLPSFAAIFHSVLWWWAISESRSSKLVVLQPYKTRLSFDMCLLTSSPNLICENFASKFNLQVILYY